MFSALPHEMVIGHISTKIIERIVAKKQESKSGRRENLQKIYRHFKMDSTRKPPTINCLYNAFIIELFVPQLLAEMAKTPRSK